MAQSETARAAYDRANTKFKNGDVDGAIAAYTEVIRLYPGYADAYNDRGWIRFKKGDHDGAVADFDEAIRLKPDSALAYVNRGWVKLSAGDHDGAIEDCTEAIRLAPRYTVAYNNRGCAREAKGDFAGAIADYTEAIRFDRGIPYSPEAPDAHYKRGLLRLLNGDTPGAVADLRRSLGKNGDDIYRALWYASVSGHWIVQEHNQEMRSEHERRRGESRQEREAREQREWEDHREWAARRERREVFRRERRRAGGLGAREWELALGEHYRAGGSPDALLGWAVEVGTSKSLSEGHFYVALQLDFVGKREAAKSHYEACIEQGVTGSVEYRWAEARPRQWANACTGCEGELKPSGETCSECGTKRE